MKSNLSIGLWTLLMVVSAFYRLNTPLLRAEEPRRAVVSLEMLDTDQVLFPTVLGKPYLNKPFLFNSAQAYSFKWFGVNEVTARIPSTLAYLLTAILLVWIGRILGDQQLGWLGSIIFLSLGDLLFYGTINAGELDLFFVFWLTFFLSGWLVLLKNQNRWGLLYAFIGLTAAFLTKGIPAIAFGVLSILATARSMKDFMSGGLIVVGLLVSVATYLGIYDSWGQSAALMEKLIWETGEKAEVKNGFTIGLVTVIPSLLKLTLPYVLVLLAIRKSSQKALPAWFWWWLGLNALPYLISGTVKDRYLYIFLPMIAWGLAFYWKNGVSRLGSNPRYRWIWLTIVSLVVVISLLKFTPSVIGIYVVVTCLLMVAVICFIKDELPKHLDTALMISAGLFCLKVAYQETVLVRTEPAGVSYFYKTEVYQLHTITKGESVVYFDQAIERSGQLPILDTKFNVTLAPMLPYQIPWEWRKRTGKLLLHESNVDSYTGYILMPADQMKNVQNIAEVHRFRDRWLNRDLVLVLKPK